MRSKSPERSITHQLAPLFRRVSLIHNAALDVLGLRAVEAHILVALWQDGPMTVSGVQRALGIRGSTLTGALDRLERRELLRREAVPGDRRSTRLVAPAWSKKKARQLETALTSAEEESFGGLTRTERDELQRLLTKCNNALIGDTP